MVVIVFLVMEGIKMNISSDHKKYSETIDPCILVLDESSPAPTMRLPEEDYFLYACNWNEWVKVIFNKGWQ